MTQEMRDNNVNLCIIHRTKYIRIVNKMSKYSMFFLIKNCGVTNRAAVYLES